MNSNQSSQRGAGEEEDFEDEFEQWHGRLEADKFEGLGDAAFFDFDFEGVFLLTLNVDGRQGVGNDHEDVFFGAAIGDAQVNELAVVLRSNAVNLSFDGIDVASQRIRVVAKGVYRESGARNSGRLFIKKQEAPSEEDDHGGNDTDGGGGA